MKKLFTNNGFENICSLSEQRLMHHASHEQLQSQIDSQQKTIEALQNQLKTQTDLLNKQNAMLQQISGKLNQPHMPQVQNQRVVQPSAITSRPSFNQNDQYTYRFPSTAPIARARVNYQSFVPRSQCTSNGPRGYAPSGRRLTDSEHATKMIHRQHAGAPGSSNHYYIPGEQNAIFHRAMGGSGGYEGYDRYNNSRYSVTSRTPTERERKTQEQDQLTEFYADQLQNRDLPRLLDGIKSREGKQRAEEILDNMESMMRKNPNKREYYYQLAHARTLLEEIRRTEDQRTALEGNGRSSYEQAQAKETYVNGEKVDTNEVLIPVDTTDPYKQVVITTPPDQYGKRGEILYSPHMDRTLRYNARGGVSAMIEHQIYIAKDTYYDGKVRGIKIKFGKEGTYNVDGRQVVVGKNPNQQNSPENQKPILRTLDVNAPFDVKRLYVIKAGKPNIPIDVSRLKNGQKLSWEDGISIERTNEGKLKVHFREQGAFDVIAGNGREGQLKLGRYEVGVAPQKKPLSTPQRQPEIASPETTKENILSLYKQELRQVGSDFATEKNKTSNTQIKFADIGGKLTISRIGLQTKNKLPFPKYDIMERGNRYFIVRESALSGKQEYELFPDDYTASNSRKEIFLALLNDDLRNFVL